LLQCLLRKPRSPPRHGAAPPMSLAVLEQRTQQIGRILFDRIGRGPRIWQRAWWDDQAMALTSADPITKIQLFRFIDALPTLRSDASVRRHLTEYLDEAGPSVPLLLSLPVRLAPPGRLGDRLIARLARWSATRMARRFIAGANPAAPTPGPRPDLADPSGGQAVRAHQPGPG
ncbi:MAG: hypothetical protein K6T75_11895, partial [Acetobacteraceae bacterium]|nr:hypothetical protein [Acetobacteraceae bacterium]